MQQAPETLQQPTTTERGPLGSSEAPCYVIVEGKFYADGFTLCVCKTKRRAIKKCRDDGFSYCKKDDLWSGERFGNSYYRRIVAEDFYT